MTAIRCFAIALLLLSSAPALALDPAVPSSQYFREHWQRAEGLPDSTIYALAQGAEGDLWLGTETGLVRFDGIAFRRYSRADEPAFGSNVVSYLLTARDGALWIGTRTGLIERRGAVFRRRDRPGSQAGIAIHSMHEDAAGRIWVASDGDLGYWEGERFTVFTDASGRRLTAVHAVHQGADGVLWFLDGELARRWDGSSLESQPLGGISQVLIRDREGQVWAAPPGRLLRLSGAGAPAVVTDPLLSSTILAVAVDAEGAFWISLEDRLVRYREGRFESIELEPGAPPLVAVIEEDRLGGLWLGTIGAGLWRLRVPPIRSIGTREGMRVAHANAVLESRDGAIWIATQGGGLSRFGDDGVRHFSPSDGLPSGVVCSLLEDHQGRIWAGTQSGLALSDRNEKFHSATPLIGAACVSTTLAELGDDSLLAFGTCGGFIHRRGAWSEVALPPGAGMVVGIEKDGTAGAWLASIGLGLLHWDSRAISPAVVSGESLSKELITIARDRRGRLLVGSADSGMMVLEGGRNRVLGPEQGLPEGPIYRILLAGDDLWLSGKDGLLRIRGRSFEAWMSGHAPAVEAARFGEHDGMRSSECNGGSEPSGWRARDGGLWFVTTAGAVRVDPASIERSRPAPNVRIDDVRVDGRSVAFANGSIRLAPGSGRLEIRFAAVSLLSAPLARFEYQFEGLGKGWIDAGGDRTAVATTLPPGKFRFRVRARVDDGDWIEAAAPLAVVQAPHYWQTLWFLALVLSALAGVGFGIHRLRIAALRRRFAAVTEERNRISREIHDSLTQSFAGVVLNLEAAERSGGTPERLTRAKAIARDGLAESRRFVRGLRPLALEGARLDQALAAMLREATVGTAIDAAFVASTRIGALPPAIEDELFRIGQEATANAVRYAEARHLRVELGMRKSMVEMTIRDDGRGFDPTAVQPTESGGYGLRGMRERVAALRGEFRITSAPGEGTRIEVQVPLP